MYFGQPLRQFPSSPAGGFRPAVASTSRGVAARPFSPMARGPMPVRSVAPPPTAMPNAAWQAELQRRATMRTTNQQREMDRRRYQAGSAAAAQRAAAAVQAQMQAQQAMQATQAAQITVPTPPMPAATTPTPGVSPGSPEADLRPTQDAADGGQQQPEAAPPSSSKKFIFIGLAVVAVAGIGYVVLKKKKPSKAA